MGRKLKNSDEVYAMAVCPAAGKELNANKLNVRQSEIFVEFLQHVSFQPAPESIREL